MTFRLENVVAGYGEHLVLRDVSLVVPRSSVVALLGPNGAGKTTLLRVASGLLAPQQGRVVAGDDDLTGRPPHVFARSGVCHVPAGRGVFPTLTVRENVLLQVAPSEAGRALAEAVAAFPRLGERLGQIAGTLSGGEQQMLAVARAFVTRSNVVLLDEVSMGLAPRVVAEIFEALESLSPTGRSLLLVEQYVTRALALADYVYLMNRGSMVFAGEPGELEEDAVFRSYVGAAR